MLVVILRVSETRYAIPCRRVIEVIPLVTLRPVTQAPAWIRGSFVFRGVLTPIIDLCQLIGGYPCPARLSSRIILTDCELPNGDDIKVGLLAEHVTEARHVSAKPLAGGSLGSMPYLGEAVQEAEGLLQMLHADRILLGSGGNLAEFFLHGKLTAGEADRTTPEP